MKIRTLPSSIAFPNRAAVVRGLAIIAWIAIGAILILGGTTALFYSRIQKQQAQLKQARIELVELDQLRQNAEELEQLRIKSRQIDVLQKDKEELVRLRGEVTALRPLKAQLEKLQSEKDQLSQSLKELQKTTGELSAMRTENQQLQGILTQQAHVAQASACIANLRAIQGAKGTWALEHQKAETDIPTDADLFGPDRYIIAKPACPAGGTYDLGAVNQKPICNIEGHAF